MKIFEHFGRPWSPASALCAALVLSACASKDIPGVYRVDIQQGNVVTQEMLAQLEPGMSKRKVRFVLGTPLIADAFNSDRWDYIYTFKTGTDERLQRNISVLFEGERLVRLRGDVEGALSATTVQARRRDKVVQVTGPREQRGLFASLVSIGSSDEVKSEAAAEQAEAVAAEAAADADSETQANARSALPANSIDAKQVPTIDTATTPEAELDATQEVAEEPTQSSFWDRLKNTVSGDPGTPDRNTDELIATPQELAPSNDAILSPNPASPNPDLELEASAPPTDTDAQDSIVRAAAGEGDRTEATRSTDLDGGFFARVRNGFKLFEIPDSLFEIKPPPEVESSTGDH
jgi:outer membrane protein assembly factor BamE